MSERYEEVRGKLVERGYLHGPIQRFLLRDLAASRSPLALARTSAKAAALGAPLLGGWLAASTVAANRPALGARDAVVLWLYFGALAGLALFALDLAAATLASRWAARRGAKAGDAMRAGLLVGVPVLAYLALIWAQGGPGRSVAADVVVLVGAVLTTSLVAWLAGIVSLAGIVGRTGVVPDRLRRSAIVLVAVLAPVAAAGFLIPSAVAPSGEPAPPSPFTSSSDRPSLLLVGVDGLDGALVEELAGRGAVPHLLATLARGAVYPLHRAAGLEPAEVWTTLATGMPASAHGVRSAGGSRLPGIAAPIATGGTPAALEAALRFLLPTRTVPSSGAARRVRTLWEITALSRPSAAVGWWASWPAGGGATDPARGYVVSDRALARLLAGRDNDRDTTPEALFARLASDFPAEREAMRSAFAPRFASLPEGPRAVAWESFVIDAFAWKSIGKLLDDPSVAAAFVYLPGLDILRARLGSDPASTAAIETYARWLDETVFDPLERRTGGSVVLVADPGRAAAAEAEGFVGAFGQGIGPACVGPAIDDLDVAPLALRMLGLPVSVEMQGRAPVRCFEEAPKAPDPIATWGRRGRASTPRASQDDPEMIERLKSLGYVR